MTNLPEKEIPQELVMEIHPNGRMFIEVDSLVSWFEQEEFKGLEFAKFAAYTLREMKKKAVDEPDRVITDKEYYGREEKQRE